MVTTPIQDMKGQYVLRRHGFLFLKYGSKRKELLDYPRDLTPIKKYYKTPQTPVHSLKISKFSRKEYFSEKLDEGILLGLLKEGTYMLPTSLLKTSLPAASPTSMRVGGPEGIPKAQELKGLSEGKHLCVSHSSIICYLKLSMGQEAHISSGTWDAQNAYFLSAVIVL